MIVKVLASGSKGNSTYLQTNKLKILIDIGVSYQYLASELDKLKIDPHDLDGLLITHTHCDHIKGLQSLVRKTKIPVYVTEKMIKNLKEKIPLDNIKVLEDETILSDLEINLIHTSHDTESVGYILKSEEKSIVYVTDTGYINRKYFEKLKNHSLYIIESNHDEKMLMEGPYPYILKHRVIGDKGHLSNNTTAKLLTEFVGNNTKKIILAHISENNNTYDLAYQTTKDALDKNNIDKEILIAKQNESLEVVEV